MNNKVPATHWQKNINKRQNAQIFISSAVSVERIHLREMMYYLLGSIEDVQNYVIQLMKYLIITKK